MKNLTLVLVILGSLGLISCQNHPPKIDSVNAAETTPPRCDSFNKSDDLTPFLDAPSLKLKVPVGRFKDEKRGISVVLLPSSSDESNLFWLWKNPQGNWQIAHKQTLVRIQSGELDAQFLHRLYPQVFPKTVLFITLPQSYWDKSLAIQPVLEKEEARWGKVTQYPVKITAQGIIHPFRELANQGDSGDSLPSHLNRVMNQVEAGSIYLPDKFSSNIQLQQPTLVNPQLCPKSGD